MIALPGLLAPWANAVIFPLSLVRMTSLLSYSPMGCARSTTPVSSTDSITYSLSQIRLRLSFTFFLTAIFQIAFSFSFPELRFLRLRFLTEISGHIRRISHPSRYLSSSSSLLRTVSEKPSFRSSPQYPVWRPCRFSSAYCRLFR